MSTFFFFAGFLFVLTIFFVQIDIGAFSLKYICDAEPSVARLHAGWAYCKQDVPFEVTCHESGR